MFAGNIGAAQDFGTIIGAAEILKDYLDIHWVIIGDGRMRPWVEDQVKKRGLTKNVHFLGRHPPKAMPRYFSLSDILLVSLKNEPIFALTIPSKVQSYLACAKPIVAALNGEGAKIIKESGAGLTCPAENPKALAKSVLFLYQMPKTELQKMGLRARDYFEKNFDHDMLIDRMEKWMIGNMRR
jgi:glycosyltransferase involved in cell wall biosynthesis